MKKIKFIISISMVLLLFLGLDGKIFAQTTIGGSTYYGSEIESYGLNVYGDYTLSEKFRVGLDLIWWPQNSPNDINYLFTETNAYLRFIPFTMNNFSFYGTILGGYHYASVRVKTLDESYKSSEHMKAFGTGAGILYNFGSFSLTAGVRNFFYSGFNQLSISGGIQIDI